ncbi:hypothetical protein [Oleispirillum naphthae]|uniref:hypothetical protein n=1 Tax=Oleispirillum naphthae TaxID=2838853 RepID=UPI0030824765
MSEDTLINSKCGHTEKLDEPAELSERTGSVYTKNDWGTDMASLTVRHRCGNDPDKQEETTYYNVATGSTVGPFSIGYETGAGSPFDYWWIKFMLNNGKVYTIKDNFYCYISSSDSGRVDLRIDGAESKLFVKFSSSSSCKVSIDPTD